MFRTMLSPNEQALHIHRVRYNSSSTFGLLMRAKLGSVQNARGRGSRVNSVGVKGRTPAMSSTTPTHGDFVLSPVSLASRDQDGGLSNSTIDIYDLTGKS